MIKRYKNITLFKKETAPIEPNSKDFYYDLLAKAEGDEKSTNAGVFWWKRSEKGLNYFSGKCRDKFTNKAGDTFPGFVLVQEDQLNELEERANGTAALKTGGYTGEVADIDNIPF